MVILSPYFSSMGWGKNSPPLRYFTPPQQLFGGRFALRFRPGKTLKKKGLQKAGVILVGGLAAALGQLVVQIGSIAVVDKMFGLQKPDEHDPVQNDRGVPAPLSLVVDAANVAQKAGVGQFGTRQRTFWSPARCPAPPSSGRPPPPPGCCRPRPVQPYPQTLP